LAKKAVKKTSSKARPSLNKKVKSASKKKPAKKTKTLIELKQIV
jgi:hypothetical protein